MVRDEQHRLSGANWVGEPLWQKIRYEESKDRGSLLHLLFQFVKTRNLKSEMLNVLYKRTKYARTSASNCVQFFNVGCIDCLFMTISR